MGDLDISPSGAIPTLPNVFATEPGDTQNSPAADTSLKRADLAGFKTGMSPTARPRLRSRQLQIRERNLGEDLRSKVRIAAR